MSVGVVIAVYNGEAYLREQLESIAAQTALPDHIWIRDDGSADSTSGVVKGFIRRHPELSVRFEQGQNLGFRDNFARLLEMAEDDWIFLCDQDDRWHPDKIEKMMKTVSSHPKIGVLASSFEFMHSDSQIYHVPRKAGWSNQNLIPREIETGALAEISLEELVFHNYFQGCSMLISREIRDACIQAKNPALPHDWMLSLLGAAKNSLYFLNTPLFDYRIHENNAIGLPQSSRFALLRRLKTLNTEYNRTIVMRQSTQVLETIRLNFPWLFKGKYEDLLAFANRNLQALEDRSPVKILAMMNDPLYSRYKSKAGALMDLVFACTHRKVTQTRSRSV